MGTPPFFTIMKCCAIVSWGPPSWNNWNNYSQNNRSILLTIAFLNIYDRKISLESLVKLNNLVIFDLEISLFSLSVFYMGI